MKKIIFSMMVLLLFSGILHADDIVVPVISINASSSLPDNTGGGNPEMYRHIRYAGDKAFDGRADTVWAEGVSGAGVGESIVIKLEKEISFDYIDILPGYFDQKYFKGNNRIKRFSMEAGGDDGWKETFSCKDMMTMQRFRLSKKVNTKDIRFFILDTYKGDRWDDTCLSELTFFSGKDRYVLLCNRIGYTRGKYSLSRVRKPFYLFPKGRWMVFNLEEGGNLSGDLAVGHQVGMEIREGKWQFHPDGTIDLSYTHHDGKKRMGPEEEDMPGPFYVSGSMKVSLIGESPSGESEFSFGDGSEFYCIILSQE